jgi:hypothetical protein
MIEFAIAEHDSGHFCLTQENVDHIVNCGIPVAGSKFYEGSLRSRPHPARWATSPEGEGVASLVGVAPAGSKRNRRRPDPHPSGFARHPFLREKGRVGLECEVRFALSVRSTSPLLR